MFSVCCCVGAVSLAMLHEYLWWCCYRDIGDVTVGAVRDVTVGGVRDVTVGGVTVVLEMFQLVVLQWWWKCYSCWCYSCVGNVTVRLATLRQCSHGSVSGETGTDLVALLLLLLHLVLSMNTELLSCRP